VTIDIQPSTQMAVDIPAAGALAAPIRVAGLAIDLGAANGTLVDAVHVWAFPASAGAAVFLGAAAFGASRPDVGASFGSRFTTSGFGLTACSLPPGTYDLAVYAHSSVTNSFSNARVVRVVVN
jgi:hypothetical protein